jgi:hypothetical protein
LNLSARLGRRRPASLVLALVAGVLMTLLPGLPLSGDTAQAAESNTATVYYSTTSTDWPAYNLH